jgi:hypothetical protein
MSACENVIDNRELPEQGNILERPGKSAPGKLVRFQAEDILTIKHDRAGLWPVEPTDTVKHGGFAGAIGTDKGENLTLQDIERHVMQCSNTTEGKVDIPT